MINKAVIISTGNELITGQAVDTNSPYIADNLLTAGVEIAAVLKVGDDPQRLYWALSQGRELGDVVVGTGGLGLAAHGLTTQAIADFLGCKLQQDEPAAAALKQRFAARNMAWTASDLKLTQLPEGAVIVPNPVGAAPGFRLAIGNGKSLFWLPGVPHEMSAMLRDTVMPWIVAQGVESRRIFLAVFKIYGVSESKARDLLKAIDLPSQARFSLRPNFSDLSLRVTVAGVNAEESDFNRLCKEVRDLLGSHIYAEDESSLEAIVGQLLLLKKQTLALAESCTGGYISHRLTRIAGSSAYYCGGVVTYANEAKLRFLKVNRTTLEKHGAVSRETALEMSQAIRQRTGASIGLSVTGIAGPTGGSQEKPVGTVWMSIAQESHQEARLFRFSGDRERIIIEASQAALLWLRNALLAKTT